MVLCQLIPLDGARLYPFLPRLHSVPRRRGLQIPPPVRVFVALAAIGQALAGCSIVTPLGGGIDTDPTGSIAATVLRPADSPALPASLSEEDRRRVLGALAIALDPQGNGAAVQWDNPVTKAHGKVTPIGYAYPSKDLICRKFSAIFETVLGAQKENGAACRDKDAQWTLSELRPDK